MPPSMPSHSSLGDVAGAALVPEFPGIGAGTELFAGIIAAEHRPGRKEDHRNAGAERTHDQRRRGLVAAAHQHGAVDRLAADLLLGLHRQQVAVEHGGRLHEGFRHADRRQFDRQPAGLQHAALDVVDTALEMGVAGIEIGPGVEDADHRPAGPILRRVAHLHHARAMAEAAEIVRRRTSARCAAVRGFWASSCSLRDDLLSCPGRERIVEGRYRDGAVFGTLRSFVPPLLRNPEITAVANHRRAKGAAAQLPISPMGGDVRQDRGGQRRAPSLVHWRKDFPNCRRLPAGYARSRPVPQQHDARTQPFALLEREPDLHPVRKQPLSAAKHGRIHHQSEFIDEIVLDQRVHQRRAAVDQYVAIAAGLQFPHLLGDIAAPDGGVAPGCVGQRARGHIFRHAVDTVGKARFVLHRRPDGGEGVVGDAAEQDGVAGEQFVDLELVAFRPALERPGPVAQSRSFHADRVFDDSVERYVLAYDEFAWHFLLLRLRTNARWPVAVSRPRRSSITLSCGARLAGRERCQTGATPRSRTGPSARGMPQVAVDVFEKIVTGCMAASFGFESIQSHDGHTGLDRFKDSVLRLQCQAKF